MNRPRPKAARAGIAVVVAIGAPSAQVTDGGRQLQVRADDRNVIAYRITKDELTRLPEGRRPSCS